jgi:hypothetical protein
MLTILCALAGSRAHADWLASQSQSNGSYSTPNDLATPTQATSEAVRALRVLGRGGEVPAGDAYIAAETYHGTEYLARKIVSGVGAAALDPTLVPELLTHQNADGGFGEQSGYDSNPLDTAFALDALAANGNAAGTAATTGIGFLLQHQNADGSWFDTSGVPGVNVTALTARALYAFNGQNPAVAAASANAGIFLISQRSSAGLWAEDQLTAQALLTLATVSTDLASIQQSATALAAAQRADGSWSDDVYSTALALRALVVANARQGAATSATGGSIAGYVLSAQTNEPLANATVVLSAGGLTVHTNTAGYFSVPGVSPGNITVVVSLTGYGVASAVVAVVAGQPTTVGPLILAQSSSAAVVRGSVFDSSTQLPLAGVAISLAGTASYSVTSAADGSFELDGITPGAYTVGFHGSGYNDVSGSLTAPAGSVTAVRQGLALLGASLDTAPGTLTGQIIDATTGRALAGVALTLAAGGSAVSAADGSFSFVSVARGNQQIQATAAGYTARSYSFVFAAGQNGSLGALPLYPATGSAAPTTLTVSGTVIDGIDNHALAAATVTVPGGQTLTTDATGKFTLSGLTSLSFSLSIAETGYQTRGFTGTASGLGQVAGTFALTPTVAGSGATTSILKGTVTDAVSTLPIGGAAITAAGTSLTATSAADGTFEIDNIAASSLTLSASAPQYTARSYAITLTQAGTYSINVQLTPAPGAGTNKFQILSFAPVEGTSGANTLQHFAASIVNLQASVQTPIILVDVLDATGATIATVSPYAPGTTTTAQVSFAANQTLNLVVPWNTAQFAPGYYRVALRVVQPGTVSRDLPTGVVLTNAETHTNVTPTSAFMGQTTFNPPLAQAGSTVPVTLAALVINSGNVPLTGTAFTLTITDASGKTLTTQPATPVMIPVGNHATVSFGSWVPTTAGNLPATITAGDPTVQGTITGSLYVGDKPQGAFTVTPTQVLTGTQTVHSTVNVTGVDTTLGVSSPLVYAIRNAVLSGSQYVAVNVVNDQVSSRCLRCHVQAQSYYGLASLVGHNVGSDQNATQLVYNAIATAQQDDGGLHDNFPPAPVTETGLATWALTQAPDQLSSFTTLYKAAKLLESSAASANGYADWNADYTVAGGWWVSADATTMTVVKSLVDVLTTAQNNNVSSLPDYAPSTPLANLGGGADALRLGPDGALYTILNGSGTIVRYDLGSGTSSAVVTGLPVPCYNFRIVAPNEFYAICTQQVIHVLPDGTQSAVAGLGAGLSDVALASNGTLYVVDYYNNQVLGGPPSGPFTPYVSGGLINSPRVLEFAPDGSLYLSNYGSYNILKIATDKTVSVFADGLSYQPVYLAVQPDGSVLAQHLSEYLNSQTTPDGLMLIDAKGVAKRLFSVSGLRGLAFANGTLYMAAQDGSLRTMTVGTLDTSHLPAFAALVASAANGIVGRSGDANTDNIVQATRLIALAEARKAVTDTALQSAIDGTTAAINTLLRSRQNSDGGWGRYQGYGSDALVTALVGTGLDYVPPANDTVVINAIQYLLNNQGQDGSWYSANGILATHFAATSLVMAYMPRVLDRLGGLSVELHVNLPANIALANPSPAPSGALPVAGGGSAYTWQLAGVTSQGRSVTFDLSLANLAPGENRAAASAAYALSTNSFDGSQLRVDLPIPTVHASDGLSLQSVATNSATYAANSAVLVTATISNVAPTGGSGGVDFMIKAGDGTLVADLGTTAFAALASGATTSLSANWNSGTMLAGSYQVDAKLYNAAGTLVDERTAAFNIVTPTIAVTATITPDKSSYPAWGTVMLTSRVRNVSANSIDPAATATVTVTTPAGATLYTTSFSVPSLAPGALQDFVASVHLSDAATGDYPVALTVNDAFSGAVVATASGTFHVNRLDVQALTGKVAAQSATVYQGTSELCSETVTNLSSSALAAATLTQSVVSLGTSAVVQSSNQAATFAAKQAQLFSNSVATNTLAPGAYACVLSATIGGVTQQLGSAVFQVQVPPISMTTALTIGTRGRLLALIDDEADVPRGSCGDIEMWASINPLLPPDAAISVVVKDATGAVLDTETTTLAGFKGTVNASASKSDDLSITGVSAGVLTVKLHNPKGLKFGDRITATVTSPSGAIPTLLLQSGPIGAGRGWPLTVGAPLGDFASDELQPIGTGTLPAVPEPSPAAQQAMLVSLVQANHWAYTIVTDEAAFERELRTGTYSNYALLAHRERLNFITRLELTEAVNRGGGLLYATQTDAAPIDDDEAHLGYGSLLGLKIAGAPRNASSVQITNPIISPLGVSSLAFTESTAQVTLSGATAVGIFPAYLDAYNTAVATHAYGLGKTVYVGYDLLAEATHAGSGSLHAALLQNSLEYLRPSFAALTAGEVVPLHVAITNTGIATPGQVQMTLPAGTVLVDAGGAQVTGQTLAWPFSLAQSQQLAFDAWVKLPVAAGATAFDALIQTGTTGNFVNYTDAKLTLTSTAPATLANAIALAKSSASFALESALLAIAHNQVTTGHPNIALLFLLGSATLLNGNTTPTGIALRLDIDQVLWVMSPGL